MERILATGVGGGVGQSVIKALQATPYEVVGIDASPTAAGLYAVSAGYAGLPASDPGFVGRILEVCEKEGCRLVFAGLDAELMPLASAADEMRAAGVTPVVSSPRIV